MAGGLWYLGAQFTLLALDAIGIPVIQLGSWRWLIPAGISAVELRWWPRAVAETKALSFAAGRFGADLCVLAAHAPYALRAATNLERVMLDGLANNRLLQLLLLTVALAAAVRATVSRSIASAPHAAQYRALKLLLPPYLHPQTTMVPG